MTKRKGASEKKVVAFPGGKTRQKKMSAKDAEIVAAENFFAHLPPADADHPYLVKKRMKPDGLKQDGEELIVPVYNVKTGKFLAVQRILPDGTKLYRDGASKQGGCMMPGE